MKKITLLLTAFVLLIAVQSYAQEVLPAERNTDQIQYNDDVRDFKKARKGERKRAFKRAKLRKKANKRQLRAMRRVAKADGVVSPKEKAVIKQERRKMRRQSKRAVKRKAHQRRQRIERTPDIAPERNR